MPHILCNATGNWLKRLGFVPRQGRDSFSSCHVQTGLGAQPACHRKDTGSFPRGQCETDHLRLVSRLMCRAYLRSAIRLKDQVLQIRDNFTFIYNIYIYLYYYIIFGFEGEKIAICYDKSEYYGYSKYQTAIIQNDQPGIIHNHQLPYIILS